MNFKMFEDKNWFQLIRNRVLRLSDGSVIKQDLLSTLLLINFSREKITKIKNSRIPQGINLVNNKPKSLNIPEKFS